MSFLFLIGARGPKVHELPAVVRLEYSLVWDKTKMDLAELARKRWINKWTVPRIAKYFDRSPETVQMHICNFRKGRFQKLRLNDDERAEIEPQLFDVFKGV